MDPQRWTDIERHALDRGWSKIDCATCLQSAEVGSASLPACPKCAGLGSVLTLPDTLGAISYEQYAAMHMEWGGQKAQVHRESGEVSRAEPRVSAGKIAGGS